MRIRFHQERHWAVYPMSLPFLNGYKWGFPLRMETRMKNGNLPLRSSYTEKEAAQALGISLTRLQLLLDENIFNDGGRRPPEVLLQPSDLVLLSFWNRSRPNPKVVRMPRRA